MNPTLAIQVKEDLEELLKTSECVIDCVDSGIFDVCIMPKYNYGIIMGSDIKTIIEICDYRNLSCYFRCTAEYRPQIVIMP